MMKSSRRAAAGAFALLLFACGMEGKSMAGAISEAGTAAGAPLLLRVYSDYV